MAAKYIFDRAQATTNTLLKGQLRMKVNISLVFLGAVAASTIALPAQAASLIPQQIGSNTSDIGYTGINNLSVTYLGTTSNYNINFKLGSFFGLYGGGNQPPDSAYTDAQLPYNSQMLPPMAAGLGEILGAAIVAALPGGAKIVTAAGTEVKTEFYIPKALAAQNGNQDTFLHCYTSSDTCPPDFADASTLKDVYFAQYTKTDNLPNNPPGVPTPALIPGLLGMGLAAMRKKKQAAVVAQEA
jgi:hypothetical protein